MSEFDDPELERLLGRAGGKLPDVNVAYERTLGRVRQARHRRTVVVSGAACGLLFFTAAFAAGRSGDSSQLRPGDRATIDGSVDDAQPDSVSPVTEPVSATTTVTDVTTTVSMGNSGGTSGSGNTTDATANSDPSSSSPTTTPAPPVTEVFSGQGGSITVRLHNGTLELVSFDAADGFSAEVEQTDDDRVEVRFESDAHRTTIRIDLEHGAMVPTIDEEDTGDTVDTVDTGDGGHGGDG